MIVDFIVGVVAAILTPIFAVLPTGSLLSSWSALGTTLDWAHGLGRWLYFAQAFLPVREMAKVTADVSSVVIPGFMTYYFANWLYKHIPQIGGFGPGSG